MKLIMSRLTLPDAGRELLFDLSARPSRTLMTALGTLVGIATLVSTLGLAASMTSQIHARFDALTVTEVVASSTENGKDGPGGGDGLPEDSPRRAQAITGVRSAALISEIKGLEVQGSPGLDPARGETLIPVVAGSPELVSVAHAEVRGATYSPLHEASTYPVALLGRAAAEQLRVFDPALRPFIVVSGRPVVVIGIIETVERQPILLQAVVLPRRFAATLGSLPAGQLIVDTEVGAARVVGEQLAMALRPDSPAAVAVRVPESPDTTRRLISSDSAGLLVVLSGISLLIGGIGIANATLVAVLERTPEIGLRRAMGARRRHIVGQFLLSSTAIGLAGAVGGLALGVVVTAATAMILQWPPTMDPWVVAGALPLGGLIGLAAGVHPALRASRIEPIAALRAATS